MIRRKTYEEADEFRNHMEETERMPIIERERSDCDSIEACQSEMTDDYNESCDEGDQEQ